jgi:hypothetical protein
MPVAGGPFIQKTGILLEVDSADKTSYSGTGTTWINQIRPGTNNGTLNNISFDSTDAKGALVFTGSNTFVDFGNLGPSLTSSFSFQVAFEPAATASGQGYTILSYASASSTSSITFKLDYTSSNQTVVLTTFSNTGSQNIVYAMSASVASGSWNIVHGTFGSQSAALYINGFLNGGVRTTGSAVGYNASNRLYAGLNYGSTSGYYSGSVANVIVNNSELSPNAVNTNYNAVATRFNLPVVRQFVTDINVYNFMFAMIQPTDNIAIALNTFVTGLKANNIWSKMSAIYPLVGGNATDHRLNLVNPNSYRINYYGGWTHNANGITGNGTNTYGDTTFAPSGTLGINSTHFALYSRTGGGGGTTGRHGSNALWITPNDGNTLRAVVYNTDITAVQITTLNSVGVIMVSRTGSTALFSYIPSNTSFTTSSFGSDTPTITNPTASIYIGARNDITSPAYYDSRNMSFYSIGTGLTFTEAQTFGTLVQNLQIALNRQITY